MQVFFRLKNGPFSQKAKKHGKLTKSGIPGWFLNKIGYLFFRDGTPYALRATPHTHTHTHTHTHAHVDALLVPSHHVVKLAEHCRAVSGG